MQTLYIAAEIQEFTPFSITTIIRISRTRNMCLATGLKLFLFAKLLAMWAIDLKHGYGLSVKAANQVE